MLLRSVFDCGHVPPVRLSRIDCVAMPRRGPAATNIRLSPSVTARPAGAALLEDSILTRSQVDAALRYRVAYPDEIAARIELHRSETAAAETH